MRLFGFDFNLKKAPSPVHLADVLAMSQGLEQQVNDLAAEVELQRKAIEAMRKKVYRDTDQREPLDVVAGTGQGGTIPGSNGRNAWRTGDPV